MYWIQPTQLARLFWFLKKPEKSAKGSRRAVLSDETVLAYLTILPRRSPKDIPEKLVKKTIKQKVKNCPAVELSPTNQYTISDCIMGKMNAQGISTMFLLKKYAATPYNLAPSSLRNTSLSLGKTRVTGTIAMKTPLSARKKKKPVRDLQLILSVQSSLNLQQRPEAQMKRIMVWRRRDFTIIGFLMIFFMSRQTNTLNDVVQGTSTSLFVIQLFSLPSIACSIALPKFFSYTSMYSGYRLRLSGSQ